MLAVVAYQSVATNIIGQSYGLGNWTVKTDDWSESASGEKLRDFFINMRQFLFVNENQYLRKYNLSD
ncbi:hypothetical protein WN55_04060 [Dufourea novaeangliae]|uniref:Uncharacterized protein n=1 Tax=Dufourea novaeangliae TaxID=178035 RepID=A0A154NWZ9_DUFNO|nr:hypothetical protein WN55_04060 [Dufourea novaeangliae]